MMITHKITLDMMKPTLPERIQVKQGDTLSCALEVHLLCNGEPWPVPGDATPLVRWFACDPETGASARGIYDTLPDGSNAWNCAENQLDLVLVPQMFATPGLVQADVALVAENRTLATFNFEFYVNPAPADGTEPEAGNYYKVATWEQVNAQLEQLETTLTGLQAETAEALAQLEHRIFGLERILNAM